MQSSTLATLQKGKTKAEYCVPEATFREPVIRNEDHRICEFNCGRTQDKTHIKTHIPIHAGRKMTQRLHAGACGLIREQRPRGKADKIPFSPETKREKLWERHAMEGRSGSASSLLTMKRPSYRSFPGTEDITIWEHPQATLQYFGEAIYHSIPKQWPLSLTTTTLGVVTVPIVFLVHHNAKMGKFDIGQSDVNSQIQLFAVWLEDAVLETLFWFGCGVLSTVGLGSGVQTGALFLFPHVCRLALTWSKQQQQQPKLVGRRRRAAAAAPPSLASLLWSVAIPGFWSGGGSAVGELVPFLLARGIRKAGGDPFALLNAEIPSSTQAPAPAPAPILNKNQKSIRKLPTIESFDGDDATLSVSSDGSMNNINGVVEKDEDDGNSSWWTPELLLSNTRQTMESQLSQNQFWKIFALAVIPNALFDLAGLVCGASLDVSFWQFFFATWSAKALVRTPATNLWRGACGCCHFKSRIIINIEESLDELLIQGNGSYGVLDKRWCTAIVTTLGSCRLGRVCW